MIEQEHGTTNQGHMKLQLQLPFLAGLLVFHRVLMSLKQAHETGASLQKLALLILHAQCPFSMIAVICRAKCNHVCWLPGKRLAGYTQFQFHPNSAEMSGR